MIWSLIRIGRRRFTIRRLMVAVALVGLISGVTLELKSRSHRFQELADSHFDRIGGFYSLIGVPDGWKGPPQPSPELNLYHQQMFEKYEHATRYPWLPVAPDPPEPN